MSQQSGFEPFPRVIAAHRYVRDETHSQKRYTLSKPRRRRSSNLGDDPRGDIETVTLATLGDRSPPTSPVPSRHTSQKHSRRSKRRKAKRLFERWKAMSFKHTWVNPLVLCLIVVAAYLVNPSPQNPFHAALFLSYPIPRNPNDDPSTPTQYAKGGRDFAFIAFYTIFLSFTREFLMHRLIRPIAIYAGIKSRAKQSRFMEQFYTATYFALFGPFGVYVMSRTPVWYFNTVGMYEGFPHKTHEALFKAYYLLQASYWAQQMIVLLLMLEKPRKDFNELVMHHIITLSLIWLSYRFHFTYMGLAVYITHDISDCFFATSKTLNYLDSPIVGLYFGLFTGVWVYLRHYINIRILLSILTEFRTIGPFELNWETQQYKCWISQVITFSLLGALQSLNLFWLFLISRIVWRFVKTRGEDIKDDRSEYEEEEEEEQPSEAQGVEKSANGMESEKPTVLVNGRALESGPKMNGLANGKANGFANGSANGNANGNVNGNANRNVNEKVREGMKLRERKR